MLDSAGRSLAAPDPPNIPDVEFYTMELARLSDGRLFVSLTATTADGAEEPELLNHEIAADHVATLDDALALVKARVQIA
jgi:hypothetical protein